MLIAAGELYQDAAGDMAESFLDVVEFQAFVDEDTETVQAVFRLRDVPESVTRRQILNFVEYWWELTVYFAAPMQPDSQADAGMLVDTFASDPSAQIGEGIHTPVPGTPEVVPLNELWDDRFAFNSAGEMLGVPEVVGDPNADTVTLTAQIPGITSSAVFTFSTFHFDGSMDRPDNYVDMAGPAAPVELVVNAYPGPHHYEGDILTFEVAGLDGTSDLAELSLDGGEPFTVNGQWLTHDTLLLPLAFDTRGLTGSHELTLSFQDGTASHNYSLDMLPAAQRPSNETNAVWLAEEIDCCQLHYLSNTAAARDINFIAQNFAIAAEEILSQYQASIATKLDVYGSIVCGAMAALAARVSL